MHALPKRKTGRRCSFLDRCASMQDAGRRTPRASPQEKPPSKIRTYLLSFPQNIPPLLRSLCNPLCFALHRRDHACHYTKPSREPHTPPMPPLSPRPRSRSPSRAHGCPSPTRTAPRRHARRVRRTRDLRRPGMFDRARLARPPDASVTIAAGAPTGHVMENELSCRLGCPPAWHLCYQAARP